MRLRIIRTDNTNPYENLAAEEHLTFTAGEDEVILFLWQNAHTVVIGRNQNPWRECRVERIKEDGIYLARRMSGGGAVYHDMGNLNFTFIARDGLFDIARQTDIILLACRLMGIRAEKNGRNDLTADGRKFSGHAYFSSGGYNYHHGTLMMRVDPDEMMKYLSASEAKLRSNGVDSVRSRVTNLCEHIPNAGETAGLVREMQEALIRAACREYGCGPGAANELSEEALPEIPSELVNKYSSEEWRLGTRIAFGKEIEHRFNWGSVDIQLAMKGEYIHECRIYSDSLETETFSVVGELLAGCKYDRSEILGLRLPRETSATAYEILELIASTIE